MSLINQALRKAQRDRTPNRIAEPDAGGPATAAPAVSSGMNPSLIIGLIVAVAVLLGLVAGLSIVLFKGGESAPIAQQAPATPEKAAAEQAPTKPLEPVAPTMATSGNATPLERDTATNLVGELRKAREAAEAKAATEAIAAEEAAARAAVKPSQKIIDWLSRAKVTGVMLSETNSKVILNGKTYAVGDYANYSLGLKIMIIQEKRLLFVDNNGKKYMKRF